MSAFVLCAAAAHPTTAGTVRVEVQEVTTDDYAAFLNAKLRISYDPSFPLPPTFNDPRALLNTSMVYDTQGGLTVFLPTACNLFTCGMGGPTPPQQPPPHFRVRTNSGNEPINFVSWYDAVRYVNWLHNGRGSGDTETGAYALGPLGAQGIPLDPTAITRNLDATWFLPDEDEWFAAISGALDQDDTLQNWTESAAPGGRVVRGGASPDLRSVLAPNVENANLGFRVAQIIVPEPASLVLLTSAMLALLASRSSPRGCVIKN